MYSRKLISLHHRARLVISSYSNLKTPGHSATCISLFTEKSTFKTHHPVGVVRLINTSSVVPPQITKAFEAASVPSDNSSDVSSLISTIGPIPEVPIPPAPALPEILPNGEPSLASLGLDSWWPNGLFQKALELIHVSLDIPWWASIVIVTALVRIVLFPVVIRQLKANVHFSNNMPQFMVLQQKMMEARSHNDHIAATRYGLELQEFMKEKKVSPLQILKYTWVQGFVIVSFTSGLRAMCALPVESMKTGGCFHILDLTATDPTYILPLANALIVFCNLKLGVDVPKTLSQNPMVIHFIHYGVPTFIFIAASFMYNSIGVYWLSTAIIAFLQNRFVRLPKVRAYFQIPPEMKSEALKILRENQQKKKQKGALGFIANFKQGMKNSRVANEVKNRAQIDELAFERAGREPIRKTYKYNPKEVSVKQK